MTQHPRASALTQFVRAVEKAGKHVSAVEVRWENIDGRETPVWRIVTSGDAPESIEPVRLG